MLERGAQDAHGSAEQAKDNEKGEETEVSGNSVTVRAREKAMGTQMGSGNRRRVVVTAFLGFFHLFPCLCIAFVITTKAQQHLLITEKIRTGQESRQKSMSEGTGCEER